MDIKKITEFEGRVVVSRTDLLPARKAMDLAFAFKGSKKPEFRLQQQQFVYMLYEAMKQKKDVIAEGPTGLGKTRSVLAAVLPFLEKNRDLRVLILTRTVAQVKNIVDETREVVEAKEIKKDVLSISAKIGIDKTISLVDCYKPLNFNSSGSRSCSSCQLNRKKDTNDYPLLQVAGIHEMKRLSDKYCPFLIANKNLRVSKIVVAPHSMAHDSAFFNKINMDLKNTIVVVDEAHNFLSNSSSESFLKLCFAKDEGQVYISGNNINRKKNKTQFVNRIKNEFCLPMISGKIDDMMNHKKTEDGLRKLLINIHGDIDKLNIAISAMLELMPQHNFESIEFDDAYLYEDAELLVRNVKEKIIDICASIEKNVFKYKEKNYSAKFADETFFNINHIISRLKVIVTHPEEFFVEYNEKYIDFTAIHPGLTVNSTIGDALSKVYISATIKPVADVALQFGSDEPYLLELPHIFPDENYLNFYVTGFHTSPHSFNDQLVLIDDVESEVLKETLVAAIRSASGKNIGFFCSSYKMVDKVVELLKKMLESNLFNEHIMMLCQSKGGSEGDISYDLRRFMKKKYTEAASFVGYENVQSSAENIFNVFVELGKVNLTSILVAVQGGALTEGNDYSGAAMEMVVLIGIPYPGSPKDIATAKIKEDYWGMYFDPKSGVASDLAYKSDAFRKLAQSIGRAHRGPKDRAVVIMIDERLLAIKKNNDSYSMLNAKNAKKNIRLLQPPVQRISSNIVVPSCARLPGHAKKHIIKSFGCNSDAFISINDMMDKICKFYG